MKQISKPMYEAFDGSIFEDELDAEDYECKAIDDYFTSFLEDMFLPELHKKVCSSIPVDINNQKKLRAVLKEALSYFSNKLAYGELEKENNKIILKHMKTGILHQINENVRGGNSYY
ncbi:MAG: hypothetical protein ACOC22_01745 [bacterium]